MPELYVALDIPPVLTGSPIPTTVNLRLTDLETQVGLTGSMDPLTVENRLTVAQADIITAQDTADTHIADLANPHAVTAAQVGLGNCDDTADVDKPVSTLQAAAIVSALAAFPVQPVAGPLTTQLAGIVHVAPGATNYTIQALAAGGYGFVTSDEGLTFLSVVKNLQVRVSELEAKLIASGLLT